MYFSSEVADLYEFFNYHDINCSLDEQEAYILLIYGYILDDYTLSKGIRRLMPGSYIRYQNVELSFNNYYSLSTEYGESITEEQSIEEVDRLFRRAIMLQLEKDREYGYKYGYKHLVALSGGLDSRTTSWVAHEMGYTDQLNFTFSQSDFFVAIPSPGPNLN